MKARPGWRGRAIHRCRWVAAVGEGIASGAGDDCGGGGVDSWALASWTEDARRFSAAAADSISVLRQVSIVQPIYKLPQMVRPHLLMVNGRGTRGHRRARGNARRESELAVDFALEGIVGLVVDDDVGRSLHGFA